MKKIFFLCLLLLTIIIPIKVNAKQNEVNIYFFHSSNCNICEQERIFLQALKQDRYPNITLYFYEINTDDNKELMQMAKDLFKEKKDGVPFTVIGDTPILGFNQGTKAKIQQLVYEYSKKSYKNELGKKLGITYRTDLEGDPVQYKENSEYKIEETGVVDNENGNKPQQSGSVLKKYKSSIILVSAGVILFIVYIALYIKESRRGNDI